jgi:exopolysaccharide biosynthesis polyprenyl glycosylphosphotransferase
MLKERVKLFKNLMVLADLVIVAAAFFLGYLLRDPFKDNYPFFAHLWLLPVTVLVWAVLLQTLGVYESFRTKTSSEFVTLILRIAFIGFIITSSGIYVFRVGEVSREFVSFIFLYSAGLIILEKITLMNFFRFFRKRGLNFRVLLVVGTGKRAETFVEMVKTHSEWGLRILGLVDEDASRVGQSIKGSKVLGTFDDFSRIINNNVVDQVVFIVPRSWMAKIENLVYLCEEEGVKVSLAVDFFNFKFSHAKQFDLFGFPIITFESTPDEFWQLMFKRLLDILISGAGLVVFAPLFLAIAVAIKMTSPGPVFFRQKRAGTNGRQFTLFKFRTMVKNAEEKLGDLLALNEMKGPVFKMSNDPRLTSVGKFLRKSSLDEFPQLWNVFIGNMSLIGPRPALPSEVAKYKPWQRRRLSLRPGITCLWQANGRNKITDFDEWMKLDLEYIDTWSLWLDLRILFKTIPVVLIGSGAK